MNCRSIVHCYVIIHNASTTNTNVLWKKNSRADMTEDILSFDQIEEERNVKTRHAALKIYSSLVNWALDVWCVVDCSKRWMRNELHSFKGHAHSSKACLHPWVMNVHSQLVTCRRTRNFSFPFRRFGNLTGPKSLPRSCTRLGSLLEFLLNEACLEMNQHITHVWLRFHPFFFSRCAGWNVIPDSGPVVLTKPL